MYGLSLNFVGGPDKIRSGRLAQTASGFHVCELEQAPKYRTKGDLSIALDEGGKSVFLLNHPKKTFAP